MKWAIVEDQPIGVTTHLIGDIIDAGYVIDKKLVPVYIYDTFHSLAQRVYECEVSMLIDAIEKLEEVELKMALPEGYELHKRMPKEIETSLLQKFEEYKKSME